MLKRDESTGLSDCSFFGKYTHTKLLLHFAYKLKLIENNHKTQQHTERLEERKREMERRRKQHAILIENANFYKPLILRHSYSLLSSTASR